jgi:hypothetical protein
VSKLFAARGPASLCLMVARLAHLQKKQQDAEAGIDTTSLDVKAELRAMDSHPGASRAPVEDYG